MPPFSYTQLNDTLIQQLTDIVGRNKIIVDKTAMVDYSHDEYTGEEIHRFPDALVLPGSTEDVAKIMKFCHKERIPITPRGGGTGLCGGCVPHFGGVVLCLDKMNRVIELDKENLTATAESGVRLSDFYTAVEGEGLFFPPHPGDESATIGGVVSTNAGGARAVKYGVIRNFIRGLEVVLPDGEIVNLGGKFLKNSSGYNLMHLMIGSEGTLGIVTKAIIGLIAPPKVTITLVASFQHLEDAIGTVPAMVRDRILPMAIEFVDRHTIEISARHHQTPWPFQKGDAQLIMILDGQNFDEISSMADKIQKKCDEHHAIDVLIADTADRQRDILKIRSGMYDAMKSKTVEILDISIPPAEIANFVKDMRDLEFALDTWLPTYGHAADGNVHTHLMRCRWIDGSWQEIDDWMRKNETARKKCHELGKRYDGICSGEHGIGLVKKEYMSQFLGERQVHIMRGIKQAFDPDHILNPGKIFDL